MQYEIRNVPFRLVNDGTERYKADVNGRILAVLEEPKPSHSALMVWSLIELSE